MGDKDEDPLKSQEEVEADRVDGISWLYCLVFPVPSGKKAEEVEAAREAILGDLAAAGLHTILFYSSTKLQIFCKVGATDGRLLKEADIQEYRLKCDEKNLKIIAETAEPQRAPLYLDFPFPPSVEVPGEFKYKGIDNQWHDMDQTQVAKYIRQQTSLSPWKDIHVRYNDAWEHRILNEHGVQVYKTYEDGTILRPADRIKLLGKILTRTKLKDPEHGLAGAFLDVKKLTYKKVLLASYPLQLGTARALSKELTPDKLFEEWNKPTRMPWQQPLEEIRNYAGEKIALYFAFLGHYTLWLVPPAVIGTVIFIHQMIQLNADTGSFNIVGSGTAELIASNVTVTLENGQLFNKTVYETELYTQVPEAPFFALFIALWASVLIEFWKRKEARFALRWGTSNYEKETSNRVQFKATHIIPDPTNGEPIEYYSKTSLFSKLFVSASVIAASIVVVIAAITGILVLKVVASSTEFSTGIIPASVAPQLALVVNAVVILILGNVYKLVARWLTNWENWRTNIQWEDALITKTFVFSFVNSYATLTYFAFIKSGSDILGITQLCVASAEELLANAATDDEKELIVNADVCYGSLAYSLFIIFGTQIFVNNIQEVGIPIIMAYVKKILDIRAHAKAIAKKAKQAADDVQAGFDEMGNALGVHKQSVDVAEDDEEKMDIDLENMAVRQRMKSPVEYQFYLKFYESPFDDYLELAIQFGYVSLFVAAFPIAPLLALINNFIEVRVDSYKVCILSRRPALEVAEDIGTWRKIFSIMGFVAVLSNASVILFSSTILKFDEDEEARRVWLWVLFVGAVLTLKVIIDFMVPDVPVEVAIQLKRQEFITRKVFMQEPDDEALTEAELKRLSRKYTVARTIENVDPFILQLTARTSELIRTSMPDSTIEDIFQEADTNNNKTLSLKELRKALLATPLGEHLSRYELTILVNSLDVDGDGTITLNEFRRFLNM
ncbi:Anoctamin-7 [Hondaea fermentalgiana]|uniref:Anoctamin-7 n=1 Tax=Hondaea fermentalgiana TaxID=2315210 RepID=A0A2R5G7M8_9STRA|nr:Anoctamin-7 [Hondaea fermentalgiana]|eukprot:GBG27052.1 Anoctamin-7 [Hondaea fermentalgiana]